MKKLRLKNYESRALDRIELDGHSGTIAGSRKHRRQRAIARRAAQHARLGK